MKRLISLFLSIIMVLTMFSVVGFAIEVPLASGVIDTVDGQFYWEISNDGSTLTISGEGAMPELTEAPEWSLYDFNKLVISEGVTEISVEFQTRSFVELGSENCLKS